MKILEDAKIIARKAGELIIRESDKGFEIEKKGINNLVTRVDKASEKLIIKLIKALYPKHAIIAEESEETHTKKTFKEAKYIWIIDPLDGTTNFAHGVPIYCVSIAIFKKSTAQSTKNYDYLSGELVAGVVYAPRTDELFYASAKKGAYLNGKKIKVSNVKKTAEGLTVTGFTATQRERNLPYFQAMLKKSQAIRRLGSAALDLCYIACGRFDGYWEFGLKPWDIAAGALIIEEAGGTVTDTNGNLLDLFGADILASNGKVHTEMIRTFQKI
ncbi:MAG: inositol monophosphatase family protein [Nitrospirota bacterium]